MIQTRSDRPYCASIFSRKSANVVLSDVLPGMTSCEVPGFPYPDDVQSLGLNWCPSNVDFQLRSMALQAAGAWCAILGGPGSACR